MEPSRKSEVVAYATIPREERIPNPMGPESSSPTRSRNSLNVKPKTIIGWLHDGWALEILAMLVSAAAVFTIIGVLKSHSGGPLPSWPSGVTLNVFIAGMTTIFTVSVSIPLSNGLSQLKWIRLYSKSMTTSLHSIDVMDSASRGAWGSFLLLILSRQGYIATLGALALIFSLLAGLSTQLIVQYPTQDVRVYESATLGIVRGYQSFVAGLNTSPALPTDALIQAYYNGLYSSPASDLSSSIPVSCPSGNCTWPTITTLGICSTCTNLTSKIINIANESWSGRAPPSWRAYQISGTNHSFYDHLSERAANDDHTSSGKPVSRYYFNVTQSSPSYFFDLADYTFMGLGTPLEYTGKQLEGSGAPPEPQPWAWGCVLYLCAQTIETTTINRVTSQKILSTYRNTTSADADIKIGGLFVYPPANLTLQQEAGLHLFTDTSAWEAMKSLFPQSGFTGTVGTDMFEEIKYLGSSTAIRPFYSAANNGSLPAAGGPLNFTGVNLPRVFEQMATAMTNDMRTETNSNARRAGQVLVDGQAWRTVRYVRVRWVWLVPPLTVLLLAVIFLCVVMRENGRVEAGMWKSNALAVLALDDGGGVGDGLRGCRNVESLADRARTMGVRMEWRDGDYVLEQIGT